MSTKKQPFRIQYKNSDGAKMFQFGIDDSIVDDEYIVKVYGDTRKWPTLHQGLNPNREMTIPGTSIFLTLTQDGKGMCYVKCNSDSFNKLRARYQ